ncbi:hypothetical protein PITCH_A1710025 [uncultured Desulfobacterium sp.]|uniref:Uncharacterized protein n=1 Tax=uncultured Desulfobacterium sp. TaxID=201089 RepID=A0A445MUM2_9BACT|nr:hypothetical protein PITCH_A1710025 [uncultured Desulfobacterium sp.]
MVPSADYADLRRLNNAASHICVGAPNMLWSDYCFSDRNELA